jgi:hypothetical protein
MPRAQTAASTLEAAAARAGLPLAPISPQFFVDCDIAENKGCRGGVTTRAFDFSKTHKPALTSEYPYLAEPGTKCLMDNGSAAFEVDQWGWAAHCNAQINVQTQAHINWECDKPDEAGLLEQLKTRGPISIAIDASGWQAYDGGIFPVTACGHSITSTNHAVVLVGYGEENGQAYWLGQCYCGQPDEQLCVVSVCTIVDHADFSCPACSTTAKNSWSDRWGESGSCNTHTAHGDKPESNVRSPSRAHVCSALPQATFASLRTRARAAGAPIRPPGCR